MTVSTRQHRENWRSASWRILRKAQVADYLPKDSENFGHSVNVKTTLTWKMFEINGTSWQVVQNSNRNVRVENLEYTLGLLEGVIWVVTQCYVVKYYVPEWRPKQTDRRLELTEKDSNVKREINLLCKWYKKGSVQSYNPIDDAPYIKYIKSSYW